MLEYFSNHSLTVPSLFPPFSQATHLAPHSQDFPSLYSAAPIAGYLASTLQRGFHCMYCVHIRKKPRVDCFGYSGVFTCI
jgi:hypothetical protein